MKKDKEWLVETLNKIIYFFESQEEKSDWNKGYIMGLHDYKDLVDKLEEPEKPIIPQFVADWYEENKYCIEIGLWDVMHNFVSEIPRSELEGELEEWFDNLKNKPFQTVMLMHMNGYTVSKEKRYRLRLIAPILSEDKYLNKIAGTGRYMVSSYSNLENTYQTIFTESELEQIDETGFEREEV